MHEKVVYKKRAFFRYQVSLLFDGVLELKYPMLEQMDLQGKVMRSWTENFGISMKVAFKSLRMLLPFD